MTKKMSFEQARKMQKIKERTLAGKTDFFQERPTLLNLV
jgi:hypothetical protein